MPANHSVRVTDLTTRRMIDDYLATRGATRLEPTAAALRPPKRRLDWDSLTPHATAASVYRAAQDRPRRTVSVEGWPNMTRTVVALGECPSAPGTSRSQRFNILSVGASLASLREKGLRLSDLQRYVQSGVVVLSPEEPSDD